MHEDSRKATVPEMAPPQPAPMDAPPLAEAVAPAPSDLSFGFGQKAPPVEVFIDPSLFNLVEHTSPREAARPESSKSTGHSQPAAHASDVPAPSAAPKPSGDGPQSHIRFRPMTPASLRMPLLEIPTPPSANAPVAAANSISKQATEVPQPREATQTSTSHETSTNPQISGAPQPSAAQSPEVPQTKSAPRPSLTSPPSSTPSGSAVAAPPAKPAGVEPSSTKAAASEVKISSRPAMGSSRTTAPDPAPHTELRPEKVQLPQNRVDEKLELPKPESGFEIVLGRKQIAGILFVTTALIMIAASAAYLAGKGSARKSLAAVPAAPEAGVEVTAVPAARVSAFAPAPTTPSISPAGAAATPVSGALPAPPPSVIAPASTASPLSPAKPIFAAPLRGKEYLQVTAVEKGMAEVIAQGFRARGLDAFAAATPSPKIFRVLIGPLANQAAYLRAKDTVDDLGLSAFAHRFQE